MPTTIQSTSVVGTTLNVTGNGAPPGGTVGLYVDGLLAPQRATADSSGNWSLSVTGLSTGNHNIQCADVITTLASVTTTFSPASVTVLSAVGPTTEDVTPVITGVVTNANGGNVSGVSVQVYRRASGSTTWILDGSAVSGADGSYTYEIKTALQDGLYEFMALAVDVDVPSATGSVTVSKPNEIAVLAKMDDTRFATAFDGVFIPANPPAGYVAFTAQTLNFSKPTATWSLAGESLGLSIDPTTGVCTVTDPTQFGSANERLVIVTATNIVGAASATIRVKTVAANGSIKYMDSLAGNNANDGSTPATPYATAGTGTTIRRHKRGGSYPLIGSLADGQTREDYGDPAQPRPIIGSGAAVGITAANWDNGVIRSLAMTDTTSRGINIQVFSNIIIEDCYLYDSKDGRLGTNAQGIKMHNTDKAAALSVPDIPGRLFNLIIRNIETKNYRGDGIYLTKVNGFLIENNKMDAAYGGGADCVQIAYENNATNISRNGLIRGNLLLQRRENQSDKGALVCERTQFYTVEYNYIGGKNFSFSAIGDDEVCRSNIMNYGRLNPYSFAYGVGEQHHLYRHHVYDNVITDAVRGIGLSAFGDATLDNGGGVIGYMRNDMEIHDNIITDCDHAFFADRPWSGYFKRNVIIRCKNVITRQGSPANGNMIANGGVYTTQDVTGNYVNDGSWLNKVPPTISGSVAPGQRVQIAGGTWTQGGVEVTPDETFVIWRNKGYDIPGASDSFYDIPADVASDFELSCVVYARKGTNWMLAVAEAAWPANAYFIPRAWLEGALPWRKRYFKLGETA